METRRIAYGLLSSSQSFSQTLVQPCSDSSPPSLPFNTKGASSLGRTPQIPSAGRALREATLHNEEPKYHVLERWNAMSMGSARHRRQLVPHALSKRSTMAREPGLGSLGPRKSGIAHRWFRSIMPGHRDSDPRVCSCMVRARARTSRSFRRFHFHVPSCLLRLKCSRSEDSIHHSLLQHTFHSCIQAQEPSIPQEPSFINSLEQCFFHLAPRIWGAEATCSHNSSTGKAPPNG